MALYKTLQCWENQVPQRSHVANMYTTTLYRNSLLSSSKFSRKKFSRQIIFTQRAHSKYSFEKFTLYNYNDIYSCKKIRAFSADEDIFTTKKANYGSNAYQYPHIVGMQCDSNEIV